MIASKNPMSSEAGASRLAVLLFIAAHSAHGTDELHGYTRISAHTIGMPEQCKADHCDNLVGPALLKENVGGNQECGKAQDVQRTKCIADAAVYCDSTPDCHGFIVPEVGKDGAGLGIWAYSANVGNAVPNDDWAIFFKEELLCTNCKGGGKPLPNPPVVARYDGGGTYNLHCADFPAPNQVFCADPSHEGIDFDIVVLVGAAAYLLGGVAWGMHVRKMKAGLAAHPHYSQMSEIRGLVKDGLQFTQRRLKGSKGSGSGMVKTSAASARLADEAEMRGTRSKKKSKKDGQHARQINESDADEKRETKEKKKNKDNKASGDASVQEPLVSGSATVAKGTARSTPSGGGGKWVHVPT
eukprot:SAG31_NODE_5813_length_2312_cov_2.499322_1_plen_355_part_00